MEITITLPGNKKVDAAFNGFTVHTDQPVVAGGDGAAPSPFDIFLASIGTCSGFYVASFCQQRGIATDTIRITQTMDYDNESHLIRRIMLTIHLHADFPVKYRDAVVHAANLCTVKRHLEAPPEISVNLAE
jgi:putative redox protein